LGLAGVVVGAGGPEGLDMPVMERLMAAADGMDVTLHRVIDVVGPWERALDQAMALGIGRVLSSGGAVTALAGIERLAAMETHAAGRLVVMPGSGVTAETVGPILRRLKTREVHASCSVTEAGDPALVRLGFAGETVRRTGAAVVRGMKGAG
jgi:copper homeostasis protein